MKFSKTEDITKNVPPSRHVEPDLFTIKVLRKDNDTESSAATVYEYTLSYAQALGIISYTESSETGYVSSITVRCAEEDFPKDIVDCYLYL